MNKKMWFTSKTNNFNQTTTITSPKIWFSKLLRISLCCALYAWCAINLSTIIYISLCSIALATLSIDNTEKPVEVIQFVTYMQSLQVYKFNNV